METIQLPPPQTTGDLSLEEALANRRSVRSFAETQLTREQIGQIVWSAQGITDGRGYRTAPSAGALYPLELYLVERNGVYRYLPGEHSLMIVTEGSKIEELYRAALEQEAVIEAPVTIVIAAVFGRTAQKYGGRAERYVHLEAGHAAQHILLQVIPMSLGAVPIGAFQDGEVQHILELPEHHQPLYLIPVGHPR